MSLLITMGLGEATGGTVPSVAIISPTPGTEIEPNDEITFTITDGVGIVAATYAGSQVYEVVHDGDSFAPLFAPLSSRSAISGGFQYTVGRLGGWLGQVTLRFFGSTG